MKIIRFWPIPCSLFCLYCLYTLIVDSYEVLYQERNEADPLQFLACLELSRVCPGKTEIDLTELKDQLYDHFNRSKEYRYWRTERYRKEFDELILKRIKSGGYLVLNRRVCLIASDQDELEEIESFLVFRTVFFIKSDTFDFIRMEHLSVNFDQLIVRKMGRPYSDCSSSNSRIHCLNECFKKRFRLARYFYLANETGSILLDYSESNRTIQESEKECFNECKRDNCKLVQLILVDEHKESKTFEAKPAISAFDFWLQIIGLIFSIVGLFFDHFASITTKLTRKLTRSRVRWRKVKVGLFYLNLTIIILNLTYCGYLCVRVALYQQAEANDLREREKMRNFIHPKTVRLAICVEIKGYDYEEKTMSEIERTTDRVLNDALKGIQVTFRGRSFRTDYHVHRKILFKILLSGHFGRCFLLSIHPNYQTIPFGPKLTIRLKEKGYFSQLYFLSEGEDLNDNSFEYYGQFGIQERIVERFESNKKCVNYKKKYENCTGRQNCLERCINRKFLEMSNRTTLGVPGYRPIIDRDWFNLSEWNTFQLMKSSYRDESLYLNVSRQCGEEISDEKECDEIRFERTFRIKKQERLTKEIDLQFDVVRSVEELPSSLRMALDLLGIQSIFFGFTLLQLFWLIYRFTKPRWRIRKDKVVWFIVCLLCSLGCSWNTVHMLDVIVNGDLVPTEHYELAERVQMPSMVFCLQIDQRLVDRNHQMTGNYLEEMTSQMNVGSTFKSIAYLNESNTWIPFYLRRVKRFFLLNLKCFKVEIDKEYDRNQFHFSGDTQALRVNFKRMKGNELVHFMTHSRVTAEFSKISNLDYSESHRYVIIHEASLYEHEDRFGFFRRRFPSLQEGDVGDIHRQLLQLQSNEPNRRTLNLPLERKHFGLEIDEDHFEELYSAQKLKNPNKRTNLNHQQMFVANHLEQFEKKIKSEFDFSFHVVFLRRVMHLTNEVNYATLTLALLNLLSLWLELGVLDLRPFLVRLHDHFLVYLYLHLPVFLLRRLIKALLFCCRWLRKLEPPLYDLIDPQQKEEEQEDSPDDSTTSDQSSVTSVASIS